MSAFTELYVRFFKAAVSALIAASIERARGDDGVSLYEAEWYYGEARAWGRAALAVRPYLNAFHVKQLEGTVMGGKYTLSNDGMVVLNVSTATK